MKGKINELYFIKIKNFPLKDMIGSMREQPYVREIFTKHISVGELYQKRTPGAQQEERE